jgi:hypothetical protein
MDAEPGSDPASRAVRLIADAYRNLIADAGRRNTQVGWNCDAGRPFRRRPNRAAGGKTRGHADQRANRQSIP